MRATFFEYQWLYKQIAEYINELLKPITNRRVENVTLDLEDNFWIKISGRNEIKFRTEYRFGQTKINDIGALIDSMSNTCIRLVMQNKKENE